MPVALPKNTPPDHCSIPNLMTSYEKKIILLFIVLIIALTVAGPTNRCLLKNKQKVLLLAKQKRQCYIYYVISWRY
jgi:hypothetical protein